eukprot:gene29138-35167_t
MPQFDPVDQDAAVKLQSVWRGHLGRKAYAHEVLQRERGRLKNKKKVQQTPSSSTNKPLSQPIPKSSPPKPPRQESLRQFVEDDDEEEDVPVLKITKQPLSSSSRNPLKGTISPHNTSSNALTSTRLSIGSYRDSLDGSGRGHLGTSVDSLGDHLSTQAQSNPYTYADNNTQAINDYYDRSRTPSPPGAYNLGQHALSMIEEGDDLADSLTYSRTNTYSHANTHAISHSKKNQLPISSPSPQSTDKPPSSEDARVVTIKKKGVAGTSAIPRYVPSSQPSQAPSSTPPTQKQPSQPVATQKTPPSSSFQPVQSTRAAVQTPPQNSFHSSPSHAPIASSGVRAGGFSGPSAGPSAGVAADILSVYEKQARQVFPQYKEEHSKARADSSERIDKVNKVLIGAPPSSSNPLSPPHTHQSAHTSTTTPRSHHPNNMTSYGVHHNAQQPALVPQQPSVPLNPNARDVHRGRSGGGGYSVGKAEVSNNPQVSYGAQPVVPTKGQPPPQQTYHTPQEPTTSNFQHRNAHPQAHAAGRPLASAAYAGHLENPGGYSAAHAPISVPSAGRHGAGNAVKAPNAIVNANPPQPSGNVAKGPSSGHGNSNNNNNAGRVGAASEERRLLSELSLLDKKLSQVQVHAHPSSVNNNHASNNPSNHSDNSHAPSPNNKKVVVDTEKKKEARAFGWGARDYKQPKTTAADNNAHATPAASAKGKEGKEESSVKNGRNAAAAVITDARQIVKEWQAASQLDQKQTDENVSIKEAVVGGAGVGYLSEFQKRQAMRSKSAGRAGRGPGDGSDALSEGARSAVSKNKLMFNAHAPPLPIETASLPPIAMDSQNKQLAYPHPLDKKSRRVGSRGSTRSAPAHM